MRLEGKSAIITGAARGIGLAIARRFVDEGARVLLVDQDEEALEETRDHVDGSGVDRLVANVADATEVRAFVARCTDTFGGVDIFVGNAGVGGEIGPLIEVSDEDFDRVIDINLKGAWYGIKYVAPKMIERGGGSIVLTSSIAGLIGAGSLGAYACSKHAVVGLMRTAALELGPLGIRVNTINPGPIETRMMQTIETHAPAVPPEAIRESFTSRIPLDRYGTPEEVANLALFLASDEASYCTGGTYVVDGGFTAH